MQHGEAGELLDRPVVMLLTRIEEGNDQSGIGYPDSAHDMESRP